jgi:hypothetical protein
MNLQEIIIKLRAYQTIIDAILSKLSISIQDVYNSDDLEYIKTILEHISEMQDVVSSLKAAYTQIQQNTQDQILQLQVYVTSPSETKDTTDGTPEEVDDEEEVNDEEEDYPTSIEAARSDIYSDFLFVPDKTKKSKWKLQVKVNGKPDIRLMGNAWAALHEGFLGNKVILPPGQKEKMIKKLVSLYHSIGKPTPAERNKGLTEKDINKSYITNYMKNDA